METIIKFLLTYWKQVVIGFIIVVLYGLVIHYKNVAKESEDNLLKVTTRLQQYAIDQEKIVADAKAKGEKDLEENTNTNLANLQIIGARYGSTIQTTQKSADNYRNELARQLQLRSNLSSNQTDKNDQNKLSETHSDTTSVGGSSEGSPDFWRTAYQGCREYLKIVKQAGAVCAADYNMCNEYVESQQAIIGVEDSN